jgi:hypothetical protein
MIYRRCLTVLLFRPRPNSLWKVKNEVDKEHKVAQFFLVNLSTFLVFFNTERTSDDPIVNRDSVYYIGRRFILNIVHPYYIDHYYYSKLVCHFSFGLAL